MQEFLNKAVELCTQAGGKVILAIVVFIVGRIIIGKIMNVLSKGKALSKVDPTAASFFKNAVKIGLYVILIVSIIGILGVPMASVVAVIASCGVAVGLALQGALGNLAGGIMLLIFRPFQVGDYIVGAGTEGNVKEIGLFYTILMTNDNQKITIPNSALTGGNVTDVTAAPTRRVDLTFNVAGSVPIKDAEAVLIGVMEGNEKVLNDPAPFAAPLEPVSGGLKYVVRAWCNTSDYWDVYFALMEDIPTALGANGMSGPASSVTIRK
ncbi:MAG: mechanosensitive ion channel [Lachnospiraceae bacterium]|nr:mechanosensitive ion channel [Lachnospiraceae bacterium]MBP3900429.1 mechanosensitive ion channel [Blautia sp.]